MFAQFNGAWSSLQPLGAANDPTGLNNNNVNLDTETLSNVDTVLRFQFASQAVGGQFTALRTAMRTN